jgi:hypothetical protein
VHSLSDRLMVLSFGPFWLRARSGFFAQVAVYNYNSQNALILMAGACNRPMVLS